MKYNASDSYALAVSYLGESIAGLHLLFEQPIKAPVPYKLKVNIQWAAVRLKFSYIGWGHKDSLMAS